MTERFSIMWRNPSPQPPPSPPSHWFFEAHTKPSNSIIILNDSNENPAYFYCFIFARIEAIEFGWWVHFIASLVPSNSKPHSSALLVCMCVCVIFFPTSTFFWLIFVLCLIYRVFVIAFRRFLFSSLSPSSSYATVRDLNTRIIIRDPFLSESSKQYFRIGKHMLVMFLCIFFLGFRLRYLFLSLCALLALSTSR